MRRWLPDLAPAVVAVALGLFLMANSVGEGDGAPVGLEVATGVLSTAGLVLFRRSHPVALMLVLLPFGILFAMPMGALPVALFSVALHRRGRVAIALAALHASLATVVYAVALGFTRPFYEGATFLVLLQVSVVAIGMLIRSHRQLVDSWAERARQAEEGQRLRVEQARLAERERIAREMHDVLAHRISLLAVHAGALEVRREASPEEQKAAGTIRQSAHDALEDLRTVIGMLRTPGEDKPQPTLGDVPALVEQSREAGAEVGLAFDGGDGVPEQVGRNAYRIVQEALTNARKHAPGAPIKIKISRTAEPGLTVEVGNALAASTSRLPGAGAGLTGLRERVQLVGGRLEHGPTPSGEFHLKAWLPWAT
ncbi:two-component sensor histidine kinase [Paractinoplanes deccanensis]|uniref:histidine kinase n=1 Tax=Paractinoplanes deccanensis TaxID=113561 RepID=A0ABQ3XUX8_9ACTN|nr:histidine kinase [Actinoplanes deccanensis]GID71537.1 two-component sensor histidine kinase [Actinoplanes deccanensis]